MDVDQTVRPLVLCENDPDTLEGLTFLLTRAGFTVAGYLCADEALPAIIDSPPLAVITDLDMPGMTGEQLCECIRETHRYEDLTVIALSGRTRERLHEISTAFNFRLQKPVAVDELLRLIENADGDKTEDSSVSDKRNNNKNGESSEISKDPALTETSKQKDDRPSQDAHNPDHLDVGEIARRDIESDRVDTDFYNTSGNDAKPPKTAETDSDSKG